MDATTGWYAIRVSGRLGATTLAAFPDLIGEARGPDTVLTGEVPDCSALYGIIAQLEALGLKLIDVQRLTAPPATLPLMSGPEAGAAC